MPTRPSLDLAVEIRTVDGVTYAYGPGARYPGDVPKGIRFATKRGDGFADASFSLSRRIDRDYVDLGLLREVTIFGTGGDTAYEGRVQGMPRSISSTHDVAVNTAGWMAHAKDRKFREIYVDRDLSRWGGPSARRQIAYLALLNGGAVVNVAADGAGAPSLIVGLTPPWDAGPVAEAWYDAAGIPLGSLYYAWKLDTLIGPADTNWSWTSFLSDDDIATSTDTSGNLRAAGPGTGTLTTAATRKYAMVALSYAAASSDKTRRTVYWTCLAAYGTHGLTKQGTASATSAQGFYASQVIKDIAARWCPKLNTAGVQDTTYLLEQVEFRDRTYPYDAFLLLNRAHRWNLSVYDNKTLYFRPTDLTDYDWEVRLSDPGVTVALQGDDVDSLANGIAVTYTDVTDGKVKSIDPDTNSQLADTNPSNPANIAGYPRWTELTLSTPVTTAMAVQFGVAALAEFNLPKAPGTIGVTGHIRDRAGHWQPVWKVRADDRVAITDHPNDRPRLVVETNYTHDGHALSISVDAPAATIDAVFDRLSLAIDTAGLGS